MKLILRLFSRILRYPAYDRAIDNFV